MSPDGIEKSQNLNDAGLAVSLGDFGPSPTVEMKPHEFLAAVAGYSQDFGLTGRALLWVFLRFPQLDRQMELSPVVRACFIGKSERIYAMHRGWTNRNRPLLPLPLDNVSLLEEKVMMTPLADFCRPHFAGLTDADIWTALSILAVNVCAGYGRASLRRRPSAAQLDAMHAVRRSVQRAMPGSPTICRTLDEAEKELSTRFLTYTGEEVPQMQVIALKQILPALPPESHGGAIDARSLVNEGTIWFLDHPEESLLAAPIKGVKLQAKVHVQRGEALSLFQLLVQRKICSWVPDDEVLMMEGQQVLNGMFAVGKGTFLPSGEEIQRVIMNLIPSNACFVHSQGGTSDLPSITQYLGLVLDQNEKLVYFQSDMTSAFYLFKIPQPWFRMMAFGVKFRGEELGLIPGVSYRPACSVIPMGWSSAVSIMQQIAERLTTLARLPSSHTVRRSAALPSWLTTTCDEAVQTGRAWFHVYLDNFCAMQRLRDEELPTLASCFHQRLEDAWDETGVLSSAKKRVSRASQALELGAALEGDQGWIGPSGERLKKLLQATLVVVKRHKLRKKWVQVIAGRWVHCMSFRRPTMSFLDTTWKYISDQVSGPLAEAKVKSELLTCICGCLLMHIVFVLASAE